ncbi:MAG: hypothetical protein PWP76_304 [Candidatus Diapherotrites archaeon]|nr:hypothetical protein [Candidatus Diapherotrites archaeon]MDN5366824.1 hypothetical protein [Candidatus Diapherotrites archaeon]
MDFGERLERLERTRSIDEIAEHVRWLKEEGVPEEKKAVLDSMVREAVGRAVQRDLNALMTFARMNPDLAIQQHGKRLRYYKSLERTLKEVIGEESVALQAVREAMSIYAGRILGIAALRAADLSSVSVAKLRMAVDLIGPYRPNVYSSHGVVKTSYVAAPPGQEFYPLVAVGLESKMYGIGQAIQAVDRNTMPKGFQAEELAKRAVPRKYMQIVNGVGGTDVYNTAREAIIAGEKIRRAEKVLLAAFEPKDVKSWSQMALDALYRKLLVEAEKAKEREDEEGLKRLARATEKVLGWNVVPKKG